MTFKDFVGVSLAVLFALALGLAIGYDKYLDVEMKRSAIEYLNNQ